MRLWTALDGSREPIALTGAAPKGLAIARTSDGDYAIATIDQARRVEVTRWSASGEPRARRFDLEPSAIELYAAKQNFLVVTEDRVLEIFALDGQRRARLVPDVGFRVVSVAIRGDAALALVEGNGGVYGRWLDLATATWGVTTPELPIEPRDVAIGPDKKLLAGRTTIGQISVIDATTGLARVGDPCHAIAGNAVKPRAIAFVDDQTLACSVQGVIRMAKLDEKIDSKPPTDRSPAMDLVGTGAFVLATKSVAIAVGRELAIADGEHVKYLGYRTSMFNHIRYEQNGILVGVGDQRVSVLDRDLRVTPPFDLPPGKPMWIDLATADERSMIALVNDGTSRSIQVIDREKHELVAGQRIVVANRSMRVDYDETTSTLLIDTEENTKRSYRFDRKTRTFDAGTAIDAPLAFFVDPARNKGSVIFAMKPIETRAFTVSELRSDGVVQRTYRVPGEFRAIDRTGRLYMALGEEGHVEDLTVFEREKTLYAIPGAAVVRTFPRRDGVYVAVLESMKLSLYDGAGKPLWSVPVWAGRDAAWVGDQLVVQLDGAFARIDLATGAYARRQCGWDFGAWDSPHTSFTGEDDLVCDVAR